MSDRLLYQSEAEQLVPERGFDVVQPEVPFSVFLGPLESRVVPYRVSKKICQNPAHTNPFLDIFT